MLRRRKTGYILLAGTALVLLVLSIWLASRVLWNHVLLPAALSADWGEGYYLPEKEVTVDLSTLPETPTEQDFARTAVELLDQETGFTTFSPTSLTWIAPCDSGVYSPDRIIVWASWYDSSDPDRQYLQGYVELQPQQSKARIWVQGEIFSEGYTVPSLLEDESRWHVEDLFHLAEEQGGLDYRQEVHNHCEILFRLSAADPARLIKYSSMEEESRFCIEVDSQTGVYTIVPSDACR